MTDNEYNTNHRLSKIISPPDTVGGTRAETDYTYDTAGRLSSILSPGGWSTTLHLRHSQPSDQDNSRGRLDRPLLLRDRDRVQLLVKVKDRAGTVTKYEYDLAGRRIKTISSYATMDLADNEHVDH